MTEFQHFHLALRGSSIRVSYQKRNERLRIADLARGLSRGYDELAFAKNRDEQMPEPEAVLGLVAYDTTEDF